MPNINPVAEKHIFYMASNTYRNVAKTLREAPNTNSYGHLNVLSYWNGLCMTLLTGCVLRSRGKSRYTQVAKRMCMKKSYTSQIQSGSTIDKWRKFRSLLNVFQKITPKVHPIKASGFDSEAKTTGCAKLFIQLFVRTWGQYIIYHWYILYLILWDTMPRPEKAWFCCMQTTKAETSLRICAAWPAPLLFAFWKATLLN